MSDKMTQSDIIKEALSELSCAEDQCRDSASYCDDIESYAYSCKELADDARYSLERAMEYVNKLKAQDVGIKVYVLYIGGKVDSYHQDKEYIKMFAELFPALQDSLAVEKYWVADLPQMLEFISRISNANITSVSQGIMSRTDDIKEGRYLNYNRDINPVTAGGLNRVALWRNESSGHDLSEWLGIKKPIEQKLLDGEIDFNETMTPELKERLLEWADEQAHMAKSVANLTKENKKDKETE